MERTYGTGMGSGNGTANRYFFRCSRRRAPTFFAILSLRVRDASDDEMTVRMTTPIKRQATTGNLMVRKVFEGLLVTG